MRRYLIPRTDLWAAPICLGTGSFKPDQEKHCHDLLDCFADLGGNLVDTASSYGQQKTGDPSVSEQIIGRWLQSRGQPADILLSTKGGHPWLEDLHRPRLDAASLSADLDQSRKNLGRDTIDLYLLHRDDPAQPVEAMLSHLETFRQLGRIRYYGLSNWSASRVSQALEWCSQLSDSGLAVVQNRWSLARYNPEGTSDDTLVAVDEPMYRLLEHKNMALLAYSAMAKGFFSKWLSCCEENQAESDEPGIPEKLKKYYMNEISTRRATAVSRIAAAHETQPSSIALAWLLAHRFPVFPVAAFSAIRQLEEAMTAPAIDLTPDEVMTLSAGSDW